MKWHKISLEGIPPWPEDETQRVLVLTMEHECKRPANPS